MTVSEKIHQRLTDALSPFSLEVIDDGDAHVGHANEGAGHYAVIIGADAFEGKPLLVCHRLVYDALGDIMRNDLHALQIKIVKR